MYDNNLYDLMAQLVHEHQSLWRIKNSYKQDARDCGECSEFWNKLEKDKEEHIRDLSRLIKSHLP